MNDALKKLEIFLEEKIFPDLDNGRPGWDLPHTKNMVEHIKLIIENSPELNLDKNVLITAAYAHDWGYSGIFKKGEVVNLTEVISAKKLHMEIGAKKILNLLQDNFFDNYFTDYQKKRVAHLVRVHDKVSELEDVDELVLMEADSISGMDPSAVKPTFSKEDNDRFMRASREKRFPKFITEYGKRKYEEFFQSRVNFYKGLDSPRKL